MVTDFIRVTLSLVVGRCLHGHEPSGFVKGRKCGQFRL